MSVIGQSFGVISAPKNGNKGSEAGDWVGGIVYCLLIDNLAGHCAIGNQEVSVAATLQQRRELWETWARYALNQNDR